jgi:hypothetical protein
MITAVIVPMGHGNREREREKKVVMKQNRARRMN